MINFAKRNNRNIVKSWIQFTPDWLVFNVLNAGQKMRVELAKLLIENDKLVLYDEFTSVVDRQVAQVGSFAIQKYVENKTSNL